MAKLKTLNETNANDKDVIKKLAEEIEMIKLRNPDGYGSAVTICHLCTHLLHRHHVVLKNINLTSKRGELIGICGSVGSGKSSLLSASMVYAIGFTTP